MLCGGHAEDPMSTFEPRNPDFAEQVRASFARQHFMSFLGAKLTDVRPGACEVRLPFRLELGQQHGYFHGGVIGTLSDNACGYAAYSLAPPGSTVLTVEYKLNIVAPGAGELLVSRGTVVRPGRTLIVCRADTFVVADGSERLCATALETLLIMVGRADSPAERR
jgi:uncharacterized protein (TIGR00369 family)